MNRATLRLSMVVATLGLLAPLAPAAAADGYPVRDSVAGVEDPRPEARLEGRGWGHGVGMSQYGAYARARDGQTAHTILTTYFRGTSLPERDTGSAILVGLRQGINCADVTSADKDVTWTVVDSSGTDRHTQSRDRTWSVRALSNGGTRVQDVPCRTEPASSNVKGRYGSDAAVEVNHHGGVVRTSDAGGEFKWGQHRIHRTGDGLSTVQRVPSVETYLKGIAEVPDSWGTHGGQAALQAQAIAARGFAMRRLANPRGGACRCDLLNSVSDQVYRGWDKEKQAPNWVQAVESTARKVLVDGNGNIANTFYSSSNGGRSENVRHVWGSTISYLVSVDDPYSRDATNPYRSWTATVSNGDLARALDGRLRSVDRVSVTSRTDGGSPARITYRGRDRDGRTIEGALGSDDGVGAGVTLRGRLSSGVDVVRADGSKGVTALPSSHVRSIDLDHYPEGADGPHGQGILWAMEAGIAQGYPDGSFRPGTSVTRAQMASFIYRTFDIPRSSSDNFRDVDPGGPHGEAVNALADAGIARGYEGREFRPGESVSRAQMASFLARTVGLDPVEPDGRFDDVGGGPHAGNIHAIADEGITQGCRSGRYCPSDPVARGQMATFLHRAVEGG